MRRAKSDLHDYQQDLVTQLYEREYLQAIVPMGGGKTVSSLTAIDEMIRDGVIRGATVLAPKRVARLTWATEAQGWSHLSDLPLTYVAGNPGQRAALLNNDDPVHVVGIDSTQWLTEHMLDWQDDDPRLDLLVIDELSRYKKHNGRRARALVLQASRFRNRWGLTGTPAPNSELDMYQPSRLIARKDIWPEDYDSWRMKYFIPEDPYTQFQWSLREEWKEKIRGDIARFSYVVDESQLPEQPDLELIPHWVEMPARALQLYRDMLRHLVVEAGGETVEAVNRAVASGKLDQLAQGFVYKDGVTIERVHRAKLDALGEILRGVGGQQVMICYWFQEDLDLLKQSFPEAGVLGSETDEAAEEGVVERWNAGQLEHLLVHPASAGHGLNLQKSSAGQIIHYGPPWSSELFRQVNDRISRQGNTRRTVFNHVILADVPSEHLKLERLQSKAANERELVADLARLSGRVV